MFYIHGASQVYTIRPRLKFYVHDFPTDDAPVEHKSAAYHPQSQGAIECFHQTLKNMMRNYCSEFEQD